MWLPNLTVGGIWFLAGAVVCAITIRLWPRFTPYGLGYLSGLLLVLVSANSQQKQQITRMEHRSIQAVITDLPVVSPHKTSFILETADHQKILVSHYRGFQTRSATTPIPDYKPGEQYHFEVLLKPPHGTANGVGFDRERWLFRHGIDAVGSIQQVRQSENLRPAFRTSLSIKINQWRHHVSGQLNRLFPDSRSNALLHALSIGDKSRFEPQDHRLFQTTGTAHIIAISGLHIGMVAAIGAGLGLLLFAVFPQQRLPRPLIQVMIGLSLAVAYAALAGFAVSTQRALIMLSVYACFKWIRRSAYAWDVWSVSLLLVLISDPLSVLDNGFWLSFWAVAVLIFAFQGRPTSSPNWLNFIKVQWLLLIGMMPLSFLQFGNLKLFTPLVNLIAIPLMTVLLIPFLLVMLFWLHLSPDVPMILVNHLDSVSRLFWRLLDWFDTMAVTPISWSVYGIWSLVLLTLAAIILLMPKAIPQRFWALLLIPIALWPQTDRPAVGHFRADILDVGQGTSVLIRTRNHHILYDVGARFPSGYNFADATIVPLLKHHRIHYLDRVILSHKDNDHAGAYPALNKAIKIGQTLSTDGRHMPCVAGQTWTWDQVRFEIISPYNLQPYLNNNSSCVLKVNGSGFSFLLTGDIEQAVEYRLSHHHRQQIQSDVLLIPHHGSNTSSTSEFVSAVNPQLAINSSGAYNQFKHPTSQVSAVYASLNIPIIDTQNSGRITLTTSHDSMDEFQIEQFRQQNPRFWRR